MKKNIVLPSLFVLNSFLVGFMPKTSKAGSTETFGSPNIDSVAYNLDFDSCYFLRQNQHRNIINNLKSNNDSTSQQKENLDSLSYKISWQGGKWVKYTSDDGSGFIRIGGSRTWRNMNPGAIRYGQIPKQFGACGTAGGFAVFPTEKHGMNALHALLKSDRYAKLTIAAAIYKYAPPSDHNNTRLYQQRLSKMTGLSLSKKLHQLTSSELNSVALAIKELEGWKPGKNEIFKAPNTMDVAALERANFLKYKDFKQKTL